ncbi:MAG: adenylate kinase family protein [Patescibacteria group bacterium]
MNLIFIGPQGSGKSTQAKILAKKKKLPYISTGDIFRNLRTENSDLARRVQEKLRKGEFVSDNDTVQVLREELSKPRYQAGFVLDGYPRNRWQAEHAPFDVDKVFYLDVSEQECVRRLRKRGREDDTEQLIRKRLADYHKKTEPILDFYRKEGILEDVDGERSIEAIAEEISSLAE